MNPLFFNPVGQWLGGTHSEIIQNRVHPQRGQLRFPEPGGRKLVTAIRHVLAAEHPHFQHLLRREFGVEIRVETTSSRLCQQVAIPDLHAVVHDDLAWFHWYGNVAHHWRRSRSVGGQVRVFPCLEAF